MDNTENSLFYDVSHKDTMKFKSIVIDVMSEACSISDDSKYNGIGTLGEKQLHAAIKRFICPDISKHEIKIDSIKSTCGENNNIGASRRRFVADILDNNTVYEIQTGSFSPLREKISWILENTEYNVAVIHPIAQTKWVSLINSESGDIEKRYKSNVRGKITDIASELYFFRDFISSARFSLIVLMLEAEQYKKNCASPRAKRPKYKKYELIPIDLISAYIFKKASDYALFIPDSLPESFTVREYSNASQIRGIDAYSIVNTLCHIGLLKEDGKSGRAKAYRRAKD